MDSNFARSLTDDIILYGDRNPHITIICTGGLTNIAQSASESLLELKVRCSVLQLNQFDPMPAERVSALLRSLNHLLIIQEIHDVDIWQAIYRSTGIPIQHVLKNSPQNKFSPQQIQDYIRQTFTYQK